MGDASNDFHRNLVRPRTEELLDVQAGELILDIACGNGNYSKKLAEMGAKVVAFDYSFKMIELAKKRQKTVLDKVAFHVCDATKFEELIKLKQERPFDKAVAKMAIMDISDLDPLFKALHSLLRPDGIFVGATRHPCFTFPNGDDFTNSMEKGEAIQGQPALQNYYHRTIADIFNVAFHYGFVVDGFYEVPFKERATPIIIIVRFRKK
ncbi:MAG: class I SAM-dependent methyltransferase [Deltaproteobacteria bacterium]|nr:class I SAM-dependent methyltransferase [Deltaproteobacteria bacterium]